MCCFVSICTKTVDVYCVFNNIDYYMTNSYSGSQEICLAKSQSVNSIQPRKFHTHTDCPAPIFAESVYRVNTTNKLKQCGSWKLLQRDY